MAALYFELSDATITVGVNITENDDGTLTFQLDVLTDTGSIGDLNGLFFDVLDATLLNGLSVSGDDITGTAIKEDGVTKVDSYNNINGEVAKDYGKFDMGVQFGTSGMAQDDIQSTSFTLSHDTMDLSLDNFLAQDFAVRLTSVGEIDGSRDDSVKIGGTAPEEPTTDDEVPVHTATNDSLTVFDDEEFNAPGMPDVLDDSSLSVLNNDITDDGAYTGIVTGANGGDFTGSIIVEGSNGGLLQVYDNGFVDFSANGEFGGLVGGESELTQFTYTIEGGSTATVDVFVFGFDHPDDEEDDEVFVGDPGDDEVGGGDDIPMDDEIYDDVPLDDEVGGDTGPTDDFLF